MKIRIFLLFICFIGTATGFIPAKVMDSVIFKLTSEFDSNLGKVSDSYAHEEIMKRGLIQSVVTYFHEQPSGSERVNLSKIEEYYDLRKLYYDYYGKFLTSCEINCFFEVLNDFKTQRKRIV